MLPQSTRFGQSHCTFKINKLKYKTIKTIALHLGRLEDEPAGAEEVGALLRAAVPVPEGGVVP